MRFLVQSRTNPRHHYLVDLLQNGGLGECSCKHWQTRIWPLIRDGKTTIEDPNSRCWHISEARLFAMNSILTDLAKKETQPCPR